MQARKGYSEKAVPDGIGWGSVICLSDQSLLIFNINKYFTYDAKLESFTEVKATDYTYSPFASNEITKVGNSDGMFIFDHVTRDPDHNDFEDVTSTLCNGESQICEMPCRLYHPVLLSSSVIVGIDDYNRLFEYVPSDGTSRTITKFDKDKKVIGLYGLKNNCLLVLDETGLLSQHQVTDSEFKKINEKEAINGLKAIYDCDDNYFVCSIYDKLGNKNAKLKNSKTKLQSWKKDTLNCFKEIEIEGVIIRKLEQLPDPNTQVFIGCDLNSLFIVDFKKGKTNIVNMASYYLDFSIADTGKLVILRTDKQGNNHIVQIEPDLLSELINQSSQAVTHTSFESLRQNPISLQSTITEEKTNGDVKDLQKLKSPTFFGSPDGSEVYSNSERTQMDVDDEKEERKDREGPGCK